MRGLVVGLPRTTWESVVAAFPDWDFTFARRSATIEELYRDLRTERRALIVTEGVTRKMLGVKISAVGVETWHLSRAPLPYLAGAEGFVLEPGTSWRGARRETEMQFLTRSGALVELSDLITHTRRLRAESRPVWASAGPRLLIASDGRRLADGAIEIRDCGAGLVPFDAHLSRPWWSVGVQQELDQALRGCTAVVTDGHPVAARLGLLGVPMVLTGRAYWTGHETAPGAVGDEDDENPLLLLATLLMSRYVVPDGLLIDPLFPRDSGR